MKLTDVQATKLKDKDKIDIAGNRYRITNLTKTFGSDRRTMVRMHLCPVDKKLSHTMLQVTSATRFTIRRKK